MKIEVGDVVRLKSGGPKMTVSGVGYNEDKTGDQPIALVIWYDVHFEYEQFPFDVLEKL